MDVEQLVRNARRLGIQTHSVAHAAYLCGHPKTQSLCCWCLERVDPRSERKAFRIYEIGGECDLCPYVGRDCLVVA